MLPFERQKRFINLLVKSVDKKCNMQISSMMLEKGMIKTMTTALFIQKARRALVPMWKAAMDAFLLGSLVVIILLASTLRSK